MSKGGLAVHSDNSSSLASENYNPKRRLENKKESRKTEKKTRSNSALYLIEINNARLNHIPKPAPEPTWTHSHGNNDSRHYSWSFRNNVGVNNNNKQQ